MGNKHKNAETVNQHYVNENVNPNYNIQSGIEKVAIVKPVEGYVVPCNNVSCLTGPQKVIVENHSNVPIVQPLHHNPQCDINTYTHETNIVSTGFNNNLPGYSNNLSTGYSNNISTGINQNQIINTDPNLVNFRGFPDCKSCLGSGWRTSSRKSGKRKLCKKCVIRSGICPKCNNTGHKLSNGKECKCIRKKYFNR